MPKLSRLTLFQLISRQGKPFSARTHEGLKELSQCVKDMSYNSLTEEMTVEFQKRGTYKYHNVPIDVFLDFYLAGSQGSYFNAYIRDQYEAERIG